MISIETFIQFGSSPQGIHPKVSQKNGGWETGRLVSFWEDTLKGTNISPFKGTFEDGFPFPKVGYVTFLENNFWEAILVFGRVNVKIIASTWPLYSLDSDSQQKVCRSSDFQLDCLTPCLSVSHLSHWQTKNLWSSTWLKTSLSHMKSLRSNTFKRHPQKNITPQSCQKKIECLNFVGDLVFFVVWLQPLYNKSRSTLSSVRVAPATSLLPPCEVRVCIRRTWTTPPATTTLWTFLEDVFSMEFPMKVTTHPGMNTPLRQSPGLANYESGIPLIVCW